MGQNHTKQTKSTTDEAQAKLKKKKKCVFTIINAGCAGSKSVLTVSDEDAPDTPSNLRRVQSTPNVSSCEEADNKKDKQDGAAASKLKRHNSLKNTSSSKKDSKKRRHSIGSPRSNIASSTTPSTESSYVLPSSNEEISSLSLDDEQSTKPNQVQQLQQEVNGVKTIMQDNVKEVIERGDNLEVLEDRAAGLKDNSEQFNKTTNKLTQKQQAVNWKNKIIMGMVAVDVILIVSTISLFICYSYYRDIQNTITAGPLLIATVTCGAITFLMISGTIAFHCLYEPKSSIENSTCEPMKSADNKVFT